MEIALFKTHKIEYYCSKSILPILVFEDVSPSVKIVKIQTMISTDYYNICVTMVKKYQWPLYFEAPLQLTITRSDIIEELSSNCCGSRWWLSIFSVCMWSGHLPALSTLSLSPHCPGCHHVTCHVSRCAGSVTANICRGFLTQADTS